jgi:N-acyl-D-aspartate/D-glutamate deacylase
MKRGVRGEGEKVLDAAEMIVAHGFIDYHNHSDLTLLVNPRAESYIHQGVTTVCIGNCGQSPAPISDEHREELEEYARAIMYPRWKAAKSSDSEKSDV